MARFIDLTGQRFGKLVARERALNTSSKRLKAGVQSHT